LNVSTNNELDHICLNMMQYTIALPFPQMFQLKHTQSTPLQSTTLLWSLQLSCIAALPSTRQNWDLTTARACYFWQYNGYKGNTSFLSTRKLTNCPFFVTVVSYWLTVVAAPSRSLLHRVSFSEGH